MSGLIQIQDTPKYTGMCKVCEDCNQTYWYEFKVSVGHSNCPMWD